MSNAILHTHNLYIYTPIMYIYVCMHEGGSAILYLFRLKKTLFYVKTLEDKLKRERKVMESTLACETTEVNKYSDQ